MVEADPAIAGGLERRRDRVRLGAARRPAGQRGLVDLPLVALEARHMGVAEDGEAVGAEREARLDRRDRTTRRSGAAGRRSGRC